MIYIFYLTLMKKKTTVRIMLRIIEVAIGKYILRLSRSITISPGSLPSPKIEPTCHNKPRAIRIAPAITSSIGKFIRME
jgi:hypothetical protein